MIKLKNVSKFYYSKGVIASGFTKVNLEFNIGEFVAITGESGSGKSTLLNVISGLDSYEEGEMYIDGVETSHYIEKDWEDYRRKNIGNIYQNFNLINSYTVYQNIDLALTLNGVKRSVRKQKILDLLKKVDLLKYKNTKVSKLSGGQKQRVAIARALAKDIPVIVADEPTGSLDKKSAVNIIKLLKEISEDKLVIIVTHNYDQVSDYVTRKITMHDGKVIEDVKVNEANIKTERVIHNYKNINIFNKIRLGVRNTFNVLPKFILLFLVYAFIVSALMGEYSYFKQNEYETSKSGYNDLFLDTSDKRIVLNKKDKSSFSAEEISNIKNLNNIDYIVENDTLLDSSFSFTTADDMWFSGLISSNKNLTTVDFGRLPVSDDEVVIEGYSYDYYLSDEINKVLDNNLYYMDSYNDNYDKSSPYKVVGVKYKDKGENTDNNYLSGEYRFYVSDKVLSDFQFMTHQKYSTITVDFMNTNYTSSSYSNQFKIEANNWVSEGKAIISENYNSYCDKENCINKTFNVRVKNLYFDDTRTFIIDKTYNSKNITSRVELNNYSKEDFSEKYDGIIYINPNDYNSLFTKGTYQMSVFVNDVESIDNTIEELNNMGYKTLKISDTLVDIGGTQLIKILKLIVTTILIFVLFFISYFIIKIILKSRNIYFSILRMLGASKRVCRQLLSIELFTISNLSYFIFVLIAYLNKNNYINIGFISTVNTYFKFNDYIILYVVITLMSLLISLRYASQLFSSTVMNTYREEF
jgi:ABC-type lipoprotein export system ATPase subunit